MCGGGGRRSSAAWARPGSGRPHRVSGGDGREEGVSEPLVCTLSGCWAALVLTPPPRAHSLNPQQPPVSLALLEMPEIHQFLDGFYLSRIGIRCGGDGARLGAGGLRPLTYLRLMHSRL